MFDLVDSIPKYSDSYATDSLDQSNSLSKAYDNIIDALQQKIYDDHVANLKTL